MTRISDEPTRCPDCGDPGCPTLESSKRPEEGELWRARRQLAASQAALEKAESDIREWKALVKHTEEIVAQVEHDSEGLARRLYDSEAQVERLRGYIGVCNKCGKPLCIMDAYCWPCHNKEVADEDAAHAAEAAKEKS